MAEWGGTKVFKEDSYYNAADYDRETDNMIFLRDELALKGYDITLPYPTTTVGPFEFPRVGYINNLKRNIFFMLSNWHVPPDVPDIIVNISRIQLFDYNDANSIERNLDFLFGLLDVLNNTHRYAGTFHAGQDIILY